MEQRTQQPSNMRAGKAFAPPGAPKLPLASPAQAAAALAGRKVGLGQSAPPAAPQPAAPPPQQHYGAPPPSHLAGPGEQLHMIHVHYLGRDGRRFVASHPFISPKGSAIQDVVPELQG